ncbi:hypothetical protein, partial [Acetomicrobium sp.]|uniref:hypothetical protein n=1 Tax=Acetomicrobium sp. TaxID=1872099 RepID=UPI001BD0473A
YAHEKHPLLDNLSHFEIIDPLARLQRRRQALFSVKIGFTWQSSTNLNIAQWAAAAVASTAARCFA